MKRSDGKLICECADCGRPIEILNAFKILNAFNCDDFQFVCDDCAYRAEERQKRMEEEDAS